MTHPEKQDSTGLRYRLSSIADGASKGLNLQLGGREVEVIALRSGATVHCYLNSCPHTGVNLDWVADQFMDNSGEFIQCATHGALFRPTDGYCVAGPCAGQSLTALKVKLDGDFFEILAALPES